MAEKGIGAGLEWGNRAGEAAGPMWGRAKAFGGRMIDKFNDSKIGNRFANWVGKQFAKDIDKTKMSKNVEKSERRGSKIGRASCRERV